MLYKGKIGHHANASMKMYASNTTYCRRKTLFQGFLDLMKDIWDKLFSVNVITTQNK